MSMGIAVPVRPRNWDRAEERYVRAERSSRGCRAGEPGWGILEIQLSAMITVDFGGYCEQL